jgi:hypothetical protein
MIKLWRFMDYHSEANNNAIEDWYLNSSAAVRAVFDVTLNHLAGSEMWYGLREFKMLKGKHSRLGEIRFMTGNVQYRILGFFGPGAREFTMLVGCEKRQWIYRPPNAMDLALKRLSLLRQGRGTIREHRL